MAYHNEQKGTNVEVLGWDPAAQTGLFTGNFESTVDVSHDGVVVDGRRRRHHHAGGGPGGTGHGGGGARARQRFIVGVDNDWFFSASDYADVVATSVLKNMDVLTYDAIVSVIDGSLRAALLPVRWRTAVSAWRHSTTWSRWSQVIWWTSLIRSRRGSSLAISRLRRNNRPHGE